MLRIDVATSMYYVLPTEYYRVIILSSYYIQVHSTAVQCNYFFVSCNISSCSSIVYTAVAAVLQPAPGSHNSSIAAVAAVRGTAAACKMSWSCLIIYLEPSCDAMGVQTFLPRRPSQKDRDYIFLIFSRVLL